MLNREEIQETILNYHTFENEIKRLIKLLNTSNNSRLPIDSSVLFKQRSDRLQKLERKVNGLMDLLETTDLTDFEFAFIDNLMDGTTITKVSKHLGIARQTSYYLLLQIADKMLAKQESTSSTNLIEQ